MVWRQEEKRFIISVKNYGKIFLKSVGTVLFVNLKSISKQLFLQGIVPLINSLLFMSLVYRAYCMIDFFNVLYLPSYDDIIVVFSCPFFSVFFFFFLH